MTKIWLESKYFSLQCTGESEPIFFFFFFVMYEMEMVQMDLKVSFIYVDLDGKWSVWEITSFLYKLILKSLVFRGAMNSILVMLCTVQFVEL